MNAKSEARVKYSYTRNANIHTYTHTEKRNILKYRIEVKSIPVHVKKFGE